MTTSNEKDRFFEALGAVYRQERDMKDDLAWEALTRGTLTKEKEEDLRRRDPALYEIYRPFDAATRKSIAARRPKEANKKPAPPLVAVPAWLTVPAVAAAASLISPWTGNAPPAVELAWSSPRGGSSGRDEPRVLRTPSEKLTEVIVPTHPVDGRLEVRGALLVRPGSAEVGRVRPWKLVSRPPPAGNEIVVAGTRLELFAGVPSGEWDMVVAVGLPGPPLAEGDMLRLMGKPSAGEYQVMTRRVVLEGECEGTAELPCPADMP